MRCVICGASCRCKNATGGICCSCHSHKGRSVRPVIKSMDRTILPPEWIAEIEAIEAEERTEQQLEMTYDSRS